MLKIDFTVNVNEETVTAIARDDDGDVFFGSGETISEALATLADDLADRGL